MNSWPARIVDGQDTGLTVPREECGQEKWSNAEKQRVVELQEASGASGRRLGEGRKQ